MCRLFGTLSSRSIDATSLLITAPQSLYVQSRIDRKRPQRDGWGAGWFEKNKPRVFKSFHAMYRDKTRVLSAARQAKGKILVSHVRWASNPLKLKRTELIGLTHTQPFTHGKYLFAHNGTLFIPKEVAAQLGPWKKYLRGKNDSEVLFYWILKHLVRRPRSDVRGLGLRTSDLALRTAQAIRGLHRVWDTCKKSYPIHKYPYHGLNWVLSDGHTLIAFCYADPRGFGKSKALCRHKEPYYQLRRRVNKEEVLIASEPIDPGPEWCAFRHGELFIAKRQGKRIKTHSVKIL